ncbi:MAG: methyltransferase domain-containing protein [Planctomycetes bacterium]|nr:methyltransferase domain-containing protein [Planctomycetota bacterium]
MKEAIRQQYEDEIRGYTGSFSSPAGEHYIRRKMDLFGAALPWPATSRRLLEVGTADGVFTRRFAGLGFDVVGLDVALAQLRIASELNTNTPLVQADGEALPFRDASFDVIVSLCTLRYLADPASALKEFARCLRPGGVLFIDVPNSYSPFFWGVGRVVDRLFGVPHPSYTRSFTRERIEREMADAGITDISLRHVLLTYRYFPTWLYVLTSAAEFLIERTPLLRRLTTLIVGTGRKPSPQAAAVNG